MGCVGATRILGLARHEDIWWETNVISFQQMSRINYLASGIRGLEYSDALGQTESQDLQDTRISGRKPNVISCKQVSRINYLGYVVWR